MNPLANTRRDMLCVRGVRSSPINLQPSVTRLLSADTMKNLRGAILL